jgi:alkylation response protein AidB-like acyl-CoA dehydrogenase
VARRDRSCYVLNGRKAAWITNGTIATHALTFFTLDPSRGMAGGGVALVPLDLRGISHAKPLDKTGQRGLDQGEIHFEEVRIPATCMIADPALYEFVLERTLSIVHGTMGAIFTGVARAAYEEALVHCRARMQGGKPISEHQLVQKRLFDMFTRVEAARALSRTVTVHNHATMPPATELAIAAKTFCTEAAFEVASSGIQLFGANAFRRGSVIERLFRDARAAQIEYGSNDVLALVAMRRLLDAASEKGRARRDRPFSIPPPQSNPVEG